MISGINQKWIIVFAIILLGFTAYIGAVSGVNVTPFPVDFSVNGTPIAQRSSMNVIDGTAVTITGVDSGAIVGVEYTVNASVSESERAFGLTVEIPDNAEDISLFRSVNGITVVWEECVLTGSATPSLGLTLRHNSDRSAAGNELVTGGNTVTSVTTGDNDVTFNDATIPADSFVWFETTAQSGTVDTASCTWGYDID